MGLGPTWLLWTAAWRLLLLVELRASCQRRRATALLDAYYTPRRGVCKGNLWGGRKKWGGGSWRYLGVYGEGGPIRGRDAHGGLRAPRAAHVALRLALRRTAIGDPSSSADECQYAPFSTLIRPHHPRP